MWNATMSCEVYASVPEFLERTESVPALYGCLVLDVRMPGPSGLDLQRILAKAKGIGVGALQAAVRRHDDRVYGTDPPRQGIDAIDHSESCLLVRDC